MPEEIAQSSGAEGLEDVSGSTGEDIGLAPDPYRDADAETSEAAPGADAELSQEGEQSEGEEAAPAAVDLDSEQATEQTTQETPEATPVFYKYGDREFKTPEDIDKHIKSVEGRQRITLASHKDALAKNDAFVKWSNDPEALRKHLAQLEGKAPEEVKVTDEKKTFLNTADWKQLTAMVDKGEGKQALATMAHMFDQALDSRLAQMEAKLQASTQPLTDAAAAQEATVSLFRTAEMAADDGGNLYWPEFNKNSDKYDPQFCQVFMQVWQQLPANVAYDEGLHGIEVAYNRTKAFLAAHPLEGATEPGAPKAEPDKSPVAGKARDAQGRFVKQTEETVTAVGGSGADPPPSSGTADSYSEAAIIRGMDRADKDRDPVFGIRK
jgi:hypothetical protein